MCIFAIEESRIYQLVNTMSLLKDVVVCKFAGCNQVFNDPRILPCGHRTCAAHIDAMTVKSNGTSSEDRKMIKCHFCEEIHKLPKSGKGFQVDSNIPLLTNMKYCNEHETAKKSFNEVTQLLDKLIKFDEEDYTIEFFEQVEADILLEKEANLQKLQAYYQELSDDVHERKVKCLHNLKANKTLLSELATIKKVLIGHENQLKKDKVDFILKTLDGDEAKWRAIQSECEAMLEKAKSLGKELCKQIVEDQMVEFMPSIRDNQIEVICGHLEASQIIDSTIIRNYTMESHLIKLCKLSGKQFKLLYRASPDGFSADDFHDKCDNQSSTLTIIKTTRGFVFGAYTAMAWDSISKHKSDPTAFIFSLTNPSKQPQFIPIKTATEAIYCCSSHGPIFGSYDICIQNNSNISDGNYSELGNSFDFKLQSPETPESFLAGSRKFKTVEVEVYKLI